MRRKYKAIMTPKDMEGLRIFLCVFFYGESSSPICIHLSFSYWLSRPDSKCRGGKMFIKKSLYVCSMVAWFNSNLLFSRGSAAATTTTSTRKNISCLAYKICIWLSRGKGLCSVLSLLCSSPLLFFVINLFSN